MGLVLEPTLWVSLLCFPGNSNLWVPKMSYGFRWIFRNSVIGLVVDGSLGRGVGLLVCVEVIGNQKLN